jgi:hypothetical protein
MPTFSGCEMALVAALGQSITNTRARDGQPSTPGPPIPSNRVSMALLIFKGI